MRKFSHQILSLYVSMSECVVYRVVDETMAYNHFSTEKKVWSNNQQQQQQKNIYKILFLINVFLV